MNVNELLDEIKVRHPGYVFIELYRDGSLKVFDYSWTEFEPAVMKHYGHYSDLVSGMVSIEDEAYGEGN
jgi:hypothetical protein